MLLYGVQKIGKTSLCSCFKDSFFLMCEPSGNALAIYQRPVKSWKEFLAYLTLLESNDEFKTVVVDTVDMLYGMCLAHCCEKQGVEHPSEVAYGIVWSDLKKEFTQGIVRLMQMQKGVILISHLIEKELKKKNGDSYTMITSSLPPIAREIVESLVDIAAYYCYGEGGQRLLCLDGDDMVVAGCRLEENFKLTRRIPMGSSKAEAYRNFMLAYENKPIPTASSEVVESSVPTVTRRVRKA